MKTSTKKGSAKARPRRGRPEKNPEERVERVVLYLLPKVVRTLDALAREDQELSTNAEPNRSRAAAALVESEQKRRDRAKARRARG